MTFASSERLAAFLRECDELAERVRVETYETGPKGRLGSCESVAASLEAKRQKMRYVPAGVEGADRAELEQHFARLLKLIESQGKLLAKVRAQTAEATSQADAGRAIARKNAALGLRKALAGLEEEKERHEEALADAATHSAIERENAKHERILGALALKVSGAMTALSAVS